MHGHRNVETVEHRTAKSIFIQWVGECLVNTLPVQMKVGISSRQYFEYTDHGRYRLEEIEAYLSTLPFNSKELG